MINQFLEHMNDDILKLIRFDEEGVDLIIPDYMDSFCEVAPLTTTDSRQVDIIEVDCPTDLNIMRAWAKSFRRKYISDEQLREMAALTRTASTYQYLVDRMYPDSESKQGKIVRIGDFGEILAADYLSYIRGYSVPSLQVRYSTKQNKNSSTMGSNLFALKFADSADRSADILCICEIKTGFSTHSRNRLADAIKDVNKDDLNQADKRASVSLAATFLQMSKMKDVTEAQLNEIRRFLNPLEDEYQQEYLAAAVIDDKYFREKTIVELDVSQSPHQDRLRLVTFHGKDLNNLMNLLFSELGALDAEFE